MDPILIFIGSDMSFFIVFVQLIYRYNANNYNLLGQSKKDLSKITGRSILGSGGMTQSDFSLNACLMFFECS